LPFPKTIGQSDSNPREKFVFGAPAQLLSVTHPISRVVVVMENDRKSKLAARSLCEKHPHDTLCVEWNPEDKHWRAASKPEGPTVNRQSLQMDKQAKVVMVGHFRADQTIAAQTPESLAVAQVALLADLGITAPRKVSLTGVCYTAPEANALSAAANSLAGRFALSLQKHGISTPITAIDGEVFINPLGRKQVVSPKGVPNVPAREHKVILDAGRDSLLSVATLPKTLLAGRRPSVSHAPHKPRAALPGSIPSLCSTAVSTPASAPPKAPAVKDAEASMQPWSLRTGWSKI
jgi:hypothetical protein